MKLKNILLVVGILAVLSGISLVLNKKNPPADEADPRVHQPLIASDTVNKAAAVRLTDKGKTVLLKKQGDSWIVVSYHDLPADFSKLARFVQDLANAKIDRFVTSNPKRIENLELKDTKVALLDASDHPLVEITIGKYAEGGGRFLCFNDEPKVYLAPISAWIDTEPKNWANSELTHFSADEVAKVSLTFPDASPVVFVRAKKGESFTAEKLPDGKQLKEATVTSLLGSLGGLRFTDTTELNDPQAVGARAHFRTATVSTFAGKTVTINLGREPEKIVAADPEAKPATSGPEAVVGSVVGKDKVTADKEGPAKVTGGPVTKTIPAGPVFVTVESSDASDPVNAIMKKCAFKVGDYIFTGLPAKPDDFFEPVPKPEPKKEPAKTVETAQASESKSAEKSAAKP
ncbi:MAG TPA: DUF4340 domain-containing protein [Rariglobus sp.]|jgi:hypothetical protein|nr:DUF4340 domain-containing protein [Rariglobus sp.]